MAWGMGVCMNLWRLAVSPAVYVSACARVNASRRSLAQSDTNPHHPISTSTYESTSTNNTEMLFGLKEGKQRLSQAVVKSEVLNVCFSRRSRRVPRRTCPADWSLYGWTPDRLRSDFQPSSHISRPPDTRKPASHWCCLWRWPRKTGNLRRRGKKAKRIREGYGGRGKTEGKDYIIFTDSFK